MSILQRIFRARDKPVSNSLPGSAFSFFFGGTAAGQAVNERSAMQMSAVYACVRILSEAIAALPLRGDTPLGRSFRFQGAALWLQHHHSEDNCAVPYFQNSGICAQKRKFPQCRKSVV